MFHFCCYATTNLKNSNRIAQLKQLTTKLFYIQPVITLEQFKPMF